MHLWFLRLSLLPRRFLTIGAKQESPAGGSPECSPGESPGAKSGSGAESRLGRCRLESGWSGVESETSQGTQCHRPAWSQIALRVRPWIGRSGRLALRPQTWQEKDRTDQWKPWWSWPAQSGPVLTTPSPRPLRKRWLVTDASGLCQWEVAKC